MPTTLKDIAKKTGFSANTVSLALKNSPRISKETRRIIQDSAESVGYCPNPIVSSFMGSVRKRKPATHISLGFMDLTPRPMKPFSPIPSLYHAACEERCKEVGASLYRFWPHEEEQPTQRLEKILRTRNIAGIVVAGIVPENWRWLLSVNHLCVINLCNELEENRFHRIRSNTFDATILCVHKLHERGYRRIGLYAVAALPAISKPFLSSYLYCRHGIPSLLPPAVTPSFDPNDFRSWLEKKRPDAVILNHRLPILFLRKTGIRIPSDLAVAALDILPTKDYDGIAGTDLQNEQVGRTAINHLLMLISQGAYGAATATTTTLIPPLWHEAASVPPTKP